MQPTSRRISLFTGLDYHVLEWAPDDPACDHTVVLIHGFLDLSWSWQTTVEAGLAGRFHLVAPDMRGHGDSDHIGPGGYYHFMDYLADLNDLIAKIGRDRVSLVGHSMGGTVASFYAGSFADDIHRLAVLEGMGPPVPVMQFPDRLASWVKGWRRAREQPMRSYANLAEAAARLRAHDSRLDSELADRLAAHGTVATADGVKFKHDPLHVSRGPYPFNLEYAQAIWRAIRCPTLLVEADDSQLLRLMPDRAETRHTCIPHAEYATITDAGHMMHRHQPEALAETLLAFLAPDPA